MARILRSTLHRAPIWLGAWMIAALCFAGVELAGDEPAAAKAPVDFENVIAPLLAKRCLECHAGAAPKGGLDLSRKAATEKGGESGAAIAAGTPDDSLLWQRIVERDMPPKKPLPDDERRLIRDWIAAGANWGKAETIDPFRFSSEARAGYDWWSLQPVRRPEPPAVSDVTWCRNPIDRFVLAGLDQRVLRPSPPAEPRKLIRRLYFDLHGLPPDPATVAEFTREMPAAEFDAAYSRLIDRLLDSPHFGERWARHWLDVVRFGESNGFERDLPRENAWPYRNWVIDAFNRDLPYDEFVRRQLAGDVLYPDDPDAVVAAGFLVAGPHDTVVPSSDFMKIGMRQDEMEDILGVVGQSFLGLTVNCARCHDHKFDPISQTEYYRLAAALAGVQHGERELPDTAFQQRQQRLAELRKRIGELQPQVQTIESAARQRVLAARAAGKLPPPDPPKAIARWDFSADLPDAKVKLSGDAKRENGRLVVSGAGTSFAASDPLPFDLAAKTLEVWVTLANLEQRGGGAISVQTLDGNLFDAIVFGERDPGQWMAGSNFFARTQSFNGPVEAEANQRPVQIAIAYHADGTMAAYRDGKPYGTAYKSAGLQPFKAGQAQIVFGLRHSPPGGNKLLAGAIHKARLYDRALSAEEVAAAFGAANGYVPEEQLAAVLTADEAERRRIAKSQLESLAAEEKQLAAAPLAKVYTVTPTATPGESRMLLRGNVRMPGDVMRPGGLASLPGLDADFKLPADAADADRRKALAAWITDRRNPLLARVMVNRLWQHHFGRGLVETPNDFGFNGARPTHPALLDWLAAELMENGWKLKHVHRLIVESAAYRQSAAANPAAAKLDADNRWLWRQNPRRLDAESLRDGILAISGKLDETIGGRGYQDVKSYFFKGTQFYDPLDNDSPAYYRRTIYRFTARGGRSPLLDTFDCPDPSTTSPNRAATTTPLQALSLMNSAFLLQMSGHLADRLQRESGDDRNWRIDRLFQLALGRPADAEEFSLCGRFADEHGWPALCRVVLNSNEFLYVE